jgi:hypothetical protein
MCACHGCGCGCGSGSGDFRVSSGAVLAGGCMFWQYEKDLAA